MQKCNIVFSIVLGSLVCSHVLASTVAIDKPDACPSVESIKAGGLAIADPLNTHYVYGAFQISDYATPQKWGFAVVNIHANSAGDALRDARQALLQLSTGFSTPIPYHNQKIGDEWVCLYNQIGDHYNTIAATPLPTLATFRTITETV